MDKLRMRTPDMTDKNIERLAELFPNIITESKDGSGIIKKAVDFDLLKQVLSKDIVEGDDERYRLDWPGKKASLLKANMPLTKTLRPCREESVNFDTTENLYIEGDNFEVLKILQESYLGRVKMIYIDPPYNTGSAMIYHNDFSKSEAEYDEEIGAINDEGKLFKNTESNGRFHSDWLSMMYERLIISRDLLAKDGVLVCAIDENEFSTLSLIIKEIFSETGCEHSYVSVIHNPRGQQGNNFSYVNEYLIFVYPSDNKKYIADFKKEQTDSRSLRDSGTESDRTDAKNCFYPFIVKNNKIIGVGDVPAISFHPQSANVNKSDGTIEVWPITDNGDEKKWRYARQSVERIIDKLEAKQGRTAIQIIYNKDFGTMRSVWTDSKYDASEYGTKLVLNLLGFSDFSYPKSLWAVYDCLFAATNNEKDAIILDYFSGSATTAHAVMQLNAEDSGNRKFIMVQLPEKTDENSEAYKTGYKTIADIGKERIRRAGKQIVEELKAKNQQLELGQKPVDASKFDIGFRVYKTDESNMKDVFYHPAKLGQKQLTFVESNIKEDRTPEDLLTQVILDLGLELSLPIETKKIGKNTVFIVQVNALVACFDNDIDFKIVDMIAGLKPFKVVFKDASFKDDKDRINVEERFKRLSPETKVTVI